MSKVNKDALKTNLTRLVGVLVKKGLKTRANKLAEETIAHLKTARQKGRNIAFYLDNSISILAPIFELKTKKVAAQKLKIPSYLKDERARAFVFTWLLLSAEKRNKKNIAKGLAEELVDSLVQKGHSVEIKEDLYREVDANRIYLKYISRR